MIRMPHLLAILVLGKKKLSKNCNHAWLFYVSVRRARVCAGAPTATGWGRGPRHLWVGGGCGTRAGALESVAAPAYNVM